MAKNAQEILTQINSKTSALEELAAQFESTSKRALTEANESVFAQEPYGAKVAGLQIRVQALTKQFTDLFQLGQHYLNDLQKLKNLSASLLSKIETPNMDRLSKVISLRVK
jgi:hypothetical protein